jgi:hypothetical protein
LIGQSVGFLWQFFWDKSGSKIFQCSFSKPTYDISYIQETIAEQIFDNQIEYSLIF